MPLYRIQWKWMKKTCTICNVMFATVCDTGKCVILTNRLPSSSAIMMRYHSVWLKRKCDVRLRSLLPLICVYALSIFPCVCIPVSYGASVHRMNENGVFNLLAWPSQSFAGFIRFSYSRNSLNEGSFYCGSLLNAYITVSIFKTQLSTISTFMWKTLKVCFCLFFVQKEGTFKSINIFAQDIS